MDHAQTDHVQTDHARSGTTPRRRRAAASTLAVALVAALVLGACSGSSDEPQDRATPSTTARTVTGGDAAKPRSTWFTRCMRRQGIVVQVQVPVKVRTKSDLKKIKDGISTQTSAQIAVRAAIRRLLTVPPPGVEPRVYRTAARRCVYGI